jgi:hypothetical protein
LNIVLRTQQKPFLWNISITVCPLILPFTVLLRLIGFKRKLGNVAHSCKRWIDLYWWQSYKFLFCFLFSEDQLSIILPIRRGGMSKQWLVVFSTLDNNKKVDVSHLKPRRQYFSCDKNLLMYSWKLMLNSRVAFVMAVRSARLSRFTDNQFTKCFPTVIQITNYKTEFHIHQTSVCSLVTLY